jgi:amino acid adenylation domain-containing protein
VPLNPAFPEQRLRSIISRARPEALLVDRETLKLLTPEILNLFPAGRILAADGVPITAHGYYIAGNPDFAAGDASAAPAQVGPEREAYLVFTSGTTGEPSGVVISTGSLNFAIRTLQERYPFGPADRFSQFFDLSFDFSVMDLFVPWQVGASTFVVPASRKMGPGRFINDHRLTVWTCVPSMITLMETMGMLPKGIFPSLRFSCFSGETLTGVAAKTWQAACPNSLVVNLYGQTEAPIGSLVQTCGPDTPPTPETGGLPLGTTLNGIAVDIVDRDGRFVEAGVTGELALTGPHLASGYLDDPARTAARFRVLNHPLHGRRPWYLTGDLGRRDADEVFHFLGRVDNELKIAGHRFMLEEIEHHLRLVSGCRLVAVVPWKSELGIVEALDGFVVGTPPAEQVMKEELRKILPRPLVPRRLKTIKEMPLSRNGKVDRKALAGLL